ncbi:unnamed protein product [Linum tenue]|uniref:VQ domain-containing protein n=1 Tax=Linum tenue TaxID=586396 RepID=A0AAV0GN94_9ROSI|nr:unnamed protein product [Linum tenue]
MSKTMSNPNDWAHFYHHNNHNQLTFSSSSAAAGVTAVTTASTITSSVSAAEPAPIQLMGSGRGVGGSGGGHNSVANSSSTLSPEGGRVAKPARRRSRASRRTPTTLLNTDTSNFRAMVQQFTGGPAGPFVTGGGSSLNVPPQPAGFSFGLGGLGQHHHQLIGDRIPNPASTVGGGGGGGGEGLFHHLQYQQSQFHQPSPFLFSLGNAGNSDDPTNIDGINSLLQRGIGTEGIGGVTSAAGTRIGGDGATAAAPPSAGSSENRNSGFLY